MQCAVFDEWSSNCKTPPQNIFEPRNFGIKKDNGTKSFWAQILWILTFFFWRPVKCFWTRKHFLNQNHFRIQQIFGPNVALRNKICLRSKFFQIYVDLHSILHLKILVKLKNFCYPYLFWDKNHLWTQNPSLDPEMRLE